ncbi:MULTISPECIES: hypothetical protein [unclassified Nocardia]|uniref:hypothetical protein n=1 Tax=unclassified Nocardia TaxID=2637762 RepID=UPI001CE41E4A|nr:MULTISPECIES: hypothetical protein [unclassified Nocardia]
MSVPQSGSTLIEGRVVHKTSNALKITFRSGPGDPLAEGVQGAGDGMGAKLAILFGFKNGGTGRHRITYADGSAVWVRSASAAPTVLSRDDGGEIATIRRGDTSTAVAATGGTLFTFVPDPAEPKTPELFRMLVRDKGDQEFGRLDVIRTAGGWSVGRLVDELYDTYIWWDRAGEPLSVPILGTRLLLRTPVDGLARDVLLGACADITLGLRPYIAAMK